MNENSPFSPSPSTGGAPTPIPFGGFGTPRAASPESESPDALTEGLNPQQLEAVTHTGSPLLIVAGAGSGKTAVLTRRIAYLMRHRGVNPWEILAITFTNKAAAEMKERVGGLGRPRGRAHVLSLIHI